MQVEQKNIWEDVTRNAKRDNSNRAIAAYQANMPDAGAVAAFGGQEAYVRGIERLPDMTTLKSFKMQKHFWTWISVPRTLDIKYNSFYAMSNQNKKHSHPGNLK